MKRQNLSTVSYQSMEDDGEDGSLVPALTLANSHEVKAHRKDCVNRVARIRGLLQNGGQMPSGAKEFLTKRLAIWEEQRDACRVLLTPVPDAMHNGKPV